MFYIKTVKVDPTPIILSKRQLGKGGEAEQYFTLECEKEFRPYVPWKTGKLKGNIIIGPDFITYSQPYAKEQYLTNRGMGKGGLCRGGLRGSHWDVRSFAVNKSKLAKRVARFCKMGVE